MRLLYILRSVASLAGTERIMTDKMNYLAEQGFEIMLVTYEQGQHPVSFPLHPSIQRVDLDCRFFTFSSMPLPRRLFAILNMQRRFGKSLRQVVDSFKPSLILTTTYSINVLDKITACHTPCIVESHIYMKSLLRHHEFPHTSPMHWMMAWMDARRLRDIRKAEWLVTLTEADTRAWQGKMKCLTIPNFVTRLPHTLAEKTERKTIISVGRLDWQKGYDKLIQAWSKIAERHKDWQVSVYGDGPLRNSLESQVREAGLQDSFHFHPATADIYTEYQKSDFYVMTSDYEGFGLVLVEAMACGLPCISFDCPVGPSEIISEGKDGFLVPLGDTDLLAERMEWLISHPDERMKMGEAAREDAQRFEKEKIMKQWMLLFEQYK